MSTLIKLIKTLMVCAATMSVAFFLSIITKGFIPNPDVFYFYAGMAYLAYLNKKD